jgi:hypothetical protein
MTVRVGTLGAGFIADSRASRVAALLTRGLNTRAEK